MVLPLCLWLLLVLRLLQRRDSYESTVTGVAGSRRLPGLNPRWQIDGACSVPAPAASALHTPTPNTQYVCPLGKSEASGGVWDMEASGPQGSNPAAPRGVHGFPRDSVLAWPLHSRHACSLGRSAHTRDARLPAWPQPPPRARHIPHTCTKGAAPPHSTSCGTQERTSPGWEEHHRRRRLSSSSRWRWYNTTNTHAGLS